MAWRETTVEKQRWALVRAWLKGGVSKAGLCLHFGISRKTGYKWLGRHAAEGRAGLADRSRAPHRQGGATRPAVVRVIVALRRRWGWGARKLMRELKRRVSRSAMPSLATVEPVSYTHLTLPTNREV